MKLNQLLGAWGMLAVLPSCVAQLDDELIESREQAFLPFGDEPNYLMDHIAVGAPIRVCLRGSNVNSSNLNDLKTRITSAIVKWGTAARAASVSAPTFDASDIQFGSSCLFLAPEIDITWNASGSGHGVDKPNGRWHVEFNGDVTEHDMLHEMGHVFGLWDTYWAGHTGCLPGQQPSVMCGRSVPGGVGYLSLQPDDINGVQELYCVANPSASECSRRAEWNTNWCSHAGGQLHVGDFNGDGHRDLLCHDVNNGTVYTAYANSQGQFGSSFWSRAMGFCYGANKELYLGKFNRDAFVDLLCHDRAAGTKTIAWATPVGQFTESNLTQTNPGWCTHATGRLHVGDFDGDGVDDLLCHDVSNGYAWIDYGGGGFNGTNWEKALNWCSHSGAQLRVGNFDGDAYDDILCQDTNDGFVWIDYAGSGGFTGTDTTYNDAFCYGTNGQMFIDDFNGDGKDDLMCHNPSSGFKKIALATNSSNPRFAGVSRQWQMNWCNGPVDQFLVGNFDYSGGADFLCHNKSTGYKYQAFQKP